MLESIQTSEKTNEDKENDEEKLKLLKLRKSLELKLIAKYDRSSIDPDRECWYIMDSLWLNKWSRFVNSVRIISLYHSLLILMLSLYHSLLTLMLNRMMKRSQGLLALKG